jgi:hypothetical protein
MIIEESVRFMLCEPIFFLQLFLCGTHGISEFLKSVGFVGLADKKSSEQDNRKLINLHNNGEDGKHAHGFADF